jgi:hypothetical protein
MACLTFMPESPRWLMKAKRPSEALTILARLRSETADPNDPVATAEHADIAAVVAREHELRHLNSYWNMFWGKGSGELHIARRVQLSVWLQIIQEYVAILSF